MEATISMPVLNPHAAGIDVGSREHFVAVGPKPGDVRVFRTYSRDHQAMIAFLKEQQISTIAMESTGDYWQTLFSALQDTGFEVLLVNGKQIKNVKGKSDMKDCQWIQRLHSVGLLTGSFLPGAAIEQLRHYQRHRNWLIEQCAMLSNKMQKALRLMNVRLDIAISDIMGKSGRLIITAILAGERDGKRLAGLADPRVKKTQDELAAAFTGNWKEELLFELADCYASYKMKEHSIQRTDAEISRLLAQAAAGQPEQVGKPKKKTVYKNQQKFDVAGLSHRYLGVDLFAIDGVSHNTVMSFISEVGLDIMKFSTGKQFVNWLRLAPNNKVSGGKTLSSRTPKGKHKLAIALRNAANTVGSMKSGSMKDFFHRIAYKKGRASAITATARKLAMIIWNMVTKQVPFRPMDEAKYTAKIKAHVIYNLKKKMARLDITAADLQLLTI